MLTGNLVRVRHARDRITPQYIEVDDPQWVAVADQLINLYRSLPGRTRAEVEEEIAEVAGTGPAQLVHQGLAKLLDDRCDYEVDADLSPEEVRGRVFQLATLRRGEDSFDRAAVIAAVAAEFAVEPPRIEQTLFADLKAEQRLMRFDDITTGQLLHRYNTALAQAVLLRAVQVRIHLSGEAPPRYRQLFRAIKFHGLICTIQPTGNGYQVTLDGPLSLFSATQKYGIQLANFLPHLLRCRRFELKARVLWGAQRKEKIFLLDSGQGLQSHTVDHGSFTPPELAMFAESFAKQIADWEIAPEAAVVPTGPHVWTPDFTLVHKKTGRRVYFEIFGYWRRTDVEQMHARLSEHLDEPFVLAVPEALGVDEKEEELDPTIYRFKRTPLPEEVARRARELLG